MKMEITALFLLFCYFIYLHFNSAQKFDVRQHLCTRTRYDAAKEVANYGTVPSSIPEECTPIHLNLVARHGTRLPTKTRSKELNTLARDLKKLVNDAKQEAERNNVSLEKIPNWLEGWQSPWNEDTNGDLIIEGEIELANLGINIRRRFNDLLDEKYDPTVFTIKSTNVSRVLESARAFSRGLFSRFFGEDHPYLKVITKSRDSDELLRFYHLCEKYKQYTEKEKPQVKKRKDAILDEISSSLASRYELNFTTKIVSSLWFLCMQEASLMGVVDKACGLFTPSEILLLEWADELEIFMLKGYGNTINYLMGVPLLEDVSKSMKNAIKAKEDNSEPGTYEKANFRFGHAETVIPFSCLLGLFLEGSDLERLKQELPLEPPPKPLLKRNWRSSLVAPFGGNIMLVLYNCPVNNTNNYYVQVLQNEVPVPLPGCDASDFCPFEAFMEKIVDPHLMHNFSSICTIKSEEPPPQEPKSEL